MNINLVKVDNVNQKVRNNSLKVIDIKLNFKNISSKNIDKLSPIIVQITGNIISSGIVVTKKKHKHFAAA